MVHTVMVDNSSATTFPEDRLGEENFSNVLEKMIKTARYWAS